MWYDKYEVVMMCHSLQSVVIQAVSTNMDIDSYYRNALNYIKNIFKAHGVSFNDFHKATGKPIREYIINEELANIITYKIKNHIKFDSPTEIKKAITECDATKCLEYSKVINEFLITNFTEEEFYKSRRIIKNKLEQIADAISKNINEKEKQIFEERAFVDEIKNNLNMAFMTIYKLCDDTLTDVDKFMLSGSCREECEELSKFSVAVIKLLKINKILSLELQIINAYAKL